MRLTRLFTFSLALCIVLLTVATTLANLRSDLDQAAEALDRAQTQDEIQQALSSFQSVADALSGKDLSYTEKGFMQSALIGIAIANLKLAKPQVAVEALNKALGMVEKNTDAIHGLLAYGYAALGDMAKAQEQAKACNMEGWQVQNLTTAKSPSEVASAYAAACAAEKGKSFGGAARGTGGGAGGSNSGASGGASGSGAGGGSSGSSGGSGGSSGGPSQGGD